MFRALAQAITPTPPAPPTVAEANAVLGVYPLQLSRWLEEAWRAGGLVAGGTGSWQQLLTLIGAGTKTPPIGDVARLQTPEALLKAMLSGVDAKPGGLTTPYVPGAGGLSLTPPPIWDHMLYAYLIEATGIVTCLGEVVRRYVVDETLPMPKESTVAWVRATEELFFRDPPLFSTGGPIASQLRPSAAVNRRNAYWRMFGMDLPHAPGDGISGQPWKTGVGSSRNSRFLELWNELLRQVWLGYENDTNKAGPNATDNSYIAYLCQTLGELLKLRRQGGTLAREEYAFVTMMSWFHLTVEHDTSVVEDLAANAGPQGNPADRLAAIGMRVGITPSRQSRELFELADLVSPLMWGIELGLFNNDKNAALLYKRDGIPNPVIAQNVNRIIDLWQSGTGERIKDLAVTTRRAGLEPRSAQPVRLLPGPLVPSPKAATNGHTPVLPRA